VIRRLKSKSINGTTIAGLRGSFVDYRLDIEKADEDGQVRAVWDASARRFTVRTAGEGVAQFVLNESASELDYGTETRKVALEFAKKDQWIWDYTDRSFNALPVTGSKDSSANAATGGGDDSLEQLQQPLFSTKGGIYPISKYPMSVYLQDPNPPGTSRVWYSLVAEEWKVYAGESLQVVPDSSIVVYVESLEQTLWRSTDKMLEYYGVEQVPVEVAFAFPRTAFGYKELGGTMIPGERDRGFEVPRGLIQVMNRDEVGQLLASGALELRASVNGGEEVMVPVAWEPVGHFRSESRTLRCVRSD
jgi:hypothetical protein